MRSLLEEKGNENGWSLTYIKDHLIRVRIIYKWAVAEEIVSVDAYQRLKTIEIRNGRRTEALGPVPDELVERTLPLLRPRIADMVKLQRLTGMRPGELVIMRPQDIDRSTHDGVWVYTPNESEGYEPSVPRKFFNTSQWRGSCIQEVCDAIALFIKPVAAAVEAKQPFVDQWTSPGPWRAG